MYYDNLLRTFPDTQDSRLKVKLFDYKQIGIFVGIGAYAYEAAGTIFSLRLSLQKPKEMPNLIIKVFIFIGIVYLMFSISFSLVSLPETLTLDLFQRGDGIKRPSNLHS